MASADATARTVAGDPAGSELSTTAGLATESSDAAKAAGPTTIAAVLPAAESGCAPTTATTRGTTATETPVA